MAVSAIKVTCNSTLYQCISFLILCSQHNIVNTNLVMCSSNCCWLKSSALWSMWNRQSLHLQGPLLDSPKNIWKFLDLNIFYGVSFHKKLQCNRNATLTSCHPDGFAQPCHRARLLLLYLRMCVPIYFVVEKVVIRFSCCLFLGHLPWKFFLHLVFFFIN